MSMETFSFSIILISHFQLTINQSLCLFTTRICFDHYSQLGQERIMKTQNPRILIFHIAKFILYLHERPCFPYRNNTNRRLYISLNVLSLHQKKTAVKIMSLFLLQKLLSSLHHKTVNILFTFRFWPDVLRHRNDSQSWAPKQNFQSNNVQGLLLGVCPPNL